MRAGKCGEHKIAGIGMAVGHRHTSDPLIDGANLVQLTEIKLRVDALCVEVEGYGHDVEVASAFAVAK